MSLSLGLILRWLEKLRARRRLKTSLESESWKLRLPSERVLRPVLATTLGLDLPPPTGCCFVSLFEGKLWCTFPARCLSTKVPNICDSKVDWWSNPPDALGTFDSIPVYADRCVLITCLALNSLRMSRRSRLSNSLCI